MLMRGPRRSGRERQVRAVLRDEPITRSDRVRRLAQSSVHIAQIGTIPRANSPRRVAGPRQAERDLRRDGPPLQRAVRTRAQPRSPSWRGDDILYANVREFREPVERLTGRTVRSFISGIDTEVNGLCTETFILYPADSNAASRSEKADL
jgi:hypothetical protein